jgi:hypothetical protein
MNQHIKRNCFNVPPPPTIPPHFTMTYTYTYIHTLKLTRWLPRHTTRRLLSTTLRATSEGSMAKVGLAIADKSGLTRGNGALPYNRLALRQILGLATLRPRGL